jgi:hypothetical protein
LLFNRFRVNYLFVNIWVCLLSMSRLLIELLFKWIDFDFGLFELLLIDIDLVLFEFIFLIDIFTLLVGWFDMIDLMR